MNSISGSEKKLSAEQLTQITTAILEGKYSWACVLMLRCTGYDPLDYLPQRTYTRLIKENSYERPLKHRKSKTSGSNSHSKFMAPDRANHSAWNEIRDLEYLDALHDCSTSAQGGNSNGLARSQQPLEKERNMSFLLDVFPIKCFF